MTEDEPEPLSPDEVDDLLSRYPQLSDLLGPRHARRFGRSVLARYAELYGSEDLRIVTANLPVEDQHPKEPTDPPDSPDPTAED